MNRKFDEKVYTFTMSLPDDDNNPLAFAMHSAIHLVRKYKLPCDVVVKELPEGVLASHVWRRNTEQCAIVLSTKLTFKGDHVSVRRKIIHEIAHHLAGVGHGHDGEFKRVASELYEREGFPKGKRGTG
jgi:hypothetical protein